MYCLCVCLLFVIFFWIEFVSKPNLILEKYTDQNSIQITLMGSKGFRGVCGEDGYSNQHADEVLRTLDLVLGKADQTDYPWMDFLGWEVEKDLHSG